MAEILAVFWLVITLLTAYIAGAKRRNWFLWLIFGAIFSLLALLAVIGMPTKQPSRRAQLESGKVRECPACRELIHAQASKCPHCQTASQPLPLRNWLGRVIETRPLPSQGSGLVRSDRQDA